MKIAVVGTGYVGLVVGTCLAEGGNDVICVDVNRRKIQMLRRGKSPIYEPGLDEILKKNIDEKRLVFTTDLGAAVKKSEVVFLALPTPQSEDGSADLKHILDVADKLGEHITRYKVIVNKSTVPVGTADKVSERISRASKSAEFDVVSNPEFLKEGNAINDFMKPDRIVIGSSSARATEIMQDLYAPFVRTGNPVIVMDVRSAELTKYAANSFLAAKISFMNEIANLCERVDADIDMVRKGIGSDARIGSQFLFAGVGYGGSCFPKDVSALANTAKEFKSPFKIIDAVQQVNKNQWKHFAGKVLKYFGGNLTGHTIAVWGLAFKPKTDDMREAPSVMIVQELLKHGATVRVHDPVANEEAKRYFGKSVHYCKMNYEALRRASALVIVTEWNEFRRPDFDRMKALMKNSIIFDGRNIYDPKLLAESGFTYFSIGRRPVNDD